MSDENHIGNAAVREGVAYGVGLLLSGLVAWLAVARKRITNYLTRNQRKSNELMAMMTDAFNKSTEASERNTTELKGIRMELGDIGKTHRTMSIEMRVFSTMAMIAFRESDVARWVTDKHGMCIEVNAKCSELFRLTPEQMRGRGWTRRIRINQIEDVSEAFDRAYKSNGHIHYKSTYTLDYDDGTCLTVVAEQSDIVRDGDGIYQMSGTIIPIYPPLKIAA
jgi:PAS domain S-box-containing protein